MTGDENETLDEAGRAHLEKYHPEQLREYDSRAKRDLNFEPPGSAPQRPATGDVHSERMAISKALADPSRTAVLDAGFRNREEAIDRLEELGRAANGEAAQNRQASADDDYQPRSLGEYQLDKPDGRSWSDEANTELTQVKSELHKAGVNPGIAKAIFTDFGNYEQSTDEAWRTRINGCAQGINAKPGGPQNIADAEKFLNSGLSPSMLEAACLAAGSELGIRELARLGRQLRK